MKVSLESSLEKLARLLSNQYQIDVVFEGEQAYTDGKKIVLPYFETITPELYADLNGFLDHETAHCKFTQFPEVQKVINNFHQKLLNGAEDVRIEREMIKEFPGTEHHLKPLNDKLIKNIRENWAKYPWPLRFIFSVMDIMEKRELKEDLEISRHIEACKDEISKLNSCVDTRSIRIITEEICKKVLKDREEEKKEAKKESKESSKEKKSSSNSTSSKETGEGKNSKNKKVSKGKEKHDSMLTETSKESSFDQQESDIHTYINGKIKESIEKEKRNSLTGYKYGFASGKVRPFSYRYDTENDFSSKGNPEEYSKLKRSVQSLVNPIKRKLELIFKAHENARWKIDQDRGSLHAAKLSRLASDNNYRNVFKKRSITETDKIAVEILIDRSGSMGDGPGGFSKIEVAKLSVVAIGEALNSMGIPFEVTSFTSVYNAKLADAYRKAGNPEGFTRVASCLDFEIYKSFDCLKLHGITQLEASNNNDDGEAVLWAAKRLAQRSEKRKILLVLSDGMPASETDNRILQKDLKDKVSLVEKSGIEVIGIGITTDAVKHFYSDYIIVNEISDLAKKSLNKLSDLLVKGF